MNINRLINDCDKSKFQCFTCPENSFYYGEIGFIDDLGNLITDWESIPEDSLKKMKLVRNGLGVQYFNQTSDNKFNSKYEGEWKKDKKNGFGVYTYEDKSKYEGKFENDIYEGKGKFYWPNGSFYEGNWRNGRIDGQGFFKHQDGHSFEGLFKNNYYYDGERFINLFLKEDDMMNFKVKNRDYVLRHSKKETDKFTRNNIFKISNQKDLINLIEETIKSNKTPLIIRMRDKNGNNPTKDFIFKTLSRPFKEVDLRYYYLKLREKSFHDDIMNEISNTVSESVNKGYFLILNFDDCSIDYKEMFDPDIKEFYSTSGFSNFIFSPKTFLLKECWKSHFSDKVDFKIDKRFRFLVYSKFFIDYDIEEHDLLNLIEKRFEKALPSKKMNVIILSQFKEPIN